MAMCRARESSTGFEFTTRSRNRITFELHLERITHATGGDKTPTRDWCYRKTCDG